MSETRLKMELTEKGSVFQVCTDDVSEIAHSAAYLITLLGTAIEESNLKDRDGDPATSVYFVCGVISRLAASLLMKGALDADMLKHQIDLTAEAVAKYTGSDEEGASCDKTTAGE